MTHAQWFGVACLGRLVYVRCEEHRIVAPTEVIESVVAVYRCEGCGTYVRRRHLMVPPPEGQLALLGRVDGVPVNVWTQNLPRELVEGVSRHFVLRD